MKTTRRAITTKTKTKANRTKVVASTPRPDRYNDVVAGGPEAWDLEHYKANPVVVWSHDYSGNVPIGRVVALSFDEDGSLLATIEWNEATQLGQEVSQAYADGYLSAVSVGFQPGSAIERRKLPTDHPAHGDSGMYFEGPNKLLELSACSVPANGEALALRSFEGGVSKHVINVEETEDAYVVTYAKHQDAAEEPAPEEDEELAMGDEDEDEEAGYGADDDEDKEHEPGHDDEDDEYADKEHEPGHDDEDEDEEGRTAKALRPIVRQVVLELLGHDSEIRRSVSRGRRPAISSSPNPLAELFGIDK